MMTLFIASQMLFKVLDYFNELTYIFLNFSIWSGKIKMKALIVLLLVHGVILIRRKFEE